MSLHQVQRTLARRQTLGGVRFVLPVLLAIVLGALAYQLPIRSRIAVGELGDQLFLPSSEAQGQAQIERGDWYADQLSPEGRSRWTRSRATILLPGLGRGRAVQLTLYAAGWPPNPIVAPGQPPQPTVRVLAGDRVVGTFQPQPNVAPYTVTIPAAATDPSTLKVTLESSSTFTNTTDTTDARPKGIRVDALELTAGGWGTQPDWLVLGSLGLATILTMGITGGRSRRRWLVPLLGVGVALVGATALIVARLWLAALLPTILALLLFALLLAHRRRIVRGLRGVAWRLGMSRGLDWGIVAGLALLCAYLLARLIAMNVEPAQPDLIDVTSTPTDRLFQVLVRVSAVSVIGLVAVASVTVLPRGILALRRRLLTGRLSAIILGVSAGIWLGYESWLIATLPFIGHADYADNAVVARNLLRGRGWVVDYVTQFYTLVPGGSVTRPQETWPLLQPLLMLPSMALLGPTPLAARIPNIFFLTALTLLIYHIGSRIWDRRIGLLAALLTLFNLYVFRLAIYATSDLPLVVWSMAAFWLVYQAVENQELRTKNQESRIKNQESRIKNQESRTKNQEPRTKNQRHSLASLFSIFDFRFSVLGSWFFAGVFTGLMILQKPSSAIVALGMGLWALGRMIAPGANRTPITATIRRAIGPLALWTIVTLLVVSPYLIRNLRVFGKPFFSTEAYDAWVLYFRGAGAWDDIYKVYALKPSGNGVLVQSADLPNRSWILRWGWDLTINKFVQQVIAVRNFFAPRNAALGLMGATGSWLALLGIVTLRPRQRRLIGLVAAALIPYVVFLSVYWHTFGEERYFTLFIPWLALLIAWGVCWLFDRIAAIGQGRLAGLGGLIACIALVATIQPQWTEINKFLDPRYPRDYWGKDWDADLEAYAWLKQNTPANAVIMTRVPWQLTFYADRPSLMIPNADMRTILAIARYYRADYLLVNGSTTSNPEGSGDLKPLAQGKGLAGWELVKAFPPDRYGGAPIRIYRFLPNYGNAPPIAANGN